MAVVAERATVRVRGVWTAIRKRPVKVGLIVALLVGILLLRSAVLSPRSSVMPSFQFLAGHSPAFVARDRDRSSGRRSEDFYSFPGDFKSVCEVAHAELVALGYAEIEQSGGSFFATRKYLRPGSPGEMVTVRIMDGARLMVYATPKNSQYDSPDRYSYKVVPGWVSVEIHQRRPTCWQKLEWKVANLLSKMGL